MQAPSVGVAVSIIVTAILPSSCQTQTGVMSKSEPKGGGMRWTPGIPANDGIDPAALNSIYSTMTQEQHHDLRGIVIVRDGRAVSERYFNGDCADTVHDIRSATKSLTSLLVGIAIHKGVVTQR